MRRLFNLKKWLTVVDAAKHLTFLFDEEVTEADVLQLALEGNLQLSVNFVNHAYAQPCTVVSWEDTEWSIIKNLDEFLSNENNNRASHSTDINSAQYPLKVKALLDKIPVAERGKYTPNMSSIKLDNHRYLNVLKDVVTLVGIYDLTMIGDEQLDVENRYHSLTGGPAVTLTNIDGAFVQGENGAIFRIVKSWEENEYIHGSRANLKKVRQYISENKITGSEAASLLNDYEEDRKKILADQLSIPLHDQYHPATGILEDSVFIVRTDALRAFENRNNDYPMASPQYTSDKLTKLQQASTIFWRNADPNDRSTHPKNTVVQTWLEERGFSSALADKGATIIRPEWASVGRPTE